MVAITGPGGHTRGARIGQHCCQQRANLAPSICIGPMHIYICTSGGVRVDSEVTVHLEDVILSNTAKKQLDLQISKHGDRVWLHGDNRS